MEKDEVSLDELFRQAVARCKAFAVEPTEVEKLELYGLLRQSVEGDALLADKPPSLSLDFRRKALFQAHYAHRGKDPDVAMTEYIMYVERLARHCEATLV